MKKRENKYTIIMTLKHSPNKNNEKEGK